MADITDFLGIAGNVLTAWAGRPQQINVVQGKIPGTGVIGGPGPGQQQMTADGGIIEGAQMVYDCASGPPPPQCGGSAVYKKVCGEYRWVYPKRRRRKQLLTKSDAAGLAQLIGILGNGKGTQQWIATHPS